MPRSQLMTHAITSPLFAEDDDANQAQPSQAATLADIAALLGLDPTATMDDVLAAVAALPAGTDDSTTADNEFATRLMSARERATCREMGTSPRLYVLNRFAKTKARENFRPIVRLAADPKPADRPAGDFRAGDFGGYSDSGSSSKPSKTPTAKPLQTSPVKKPQRIVPGSPEAYGLNAADLKKADELGASPRDYAARKASREAQTRNTDPRTQGAKR